MGWANYHLYDFYIPYKRIRVVDEEMMDIGFGTDVYLSLTKRINPYLVENKKMIYTYDMGENWEHDIQLTKEVAEKTGIFPKVIK